MSLSFGVDGSFVQSIVTGNNTVITITGSYSETRVGELAVVNSTDIATINGDTLRVQLAGVNCGHEGLVALRRS